MPLNLWRRRRRRRRQLLLLMHYYLCSNFYYILGIILLILREEERIRKLSKLTNKPDRNKRKYRVATLLHNVRVCMCGEDLKVNRTARYFQCRPPTAISYLNLDGNDQWQLPSNQ